MDSKTDDFSDIFKGVVKVENTGGELIPLRFTGRQLERYKQIPRCCYPYASAGIKMEFITDRPVVSFGYTFGTVWQFNGPPTFDIYENGVMTHIENGVCDAMPHTVTYDRRFSEPSKITVYLPVDAETRLSDINIGNYRSTGPGQKKLLLLGDSISQGLMVRFSSLCYAALIERYCCLDILNQSVGGEIYDAAALDEALPFDPDFVVMALGTNDVYFLDDYDVIAANMDGYYEKIHRLYGKKKVVAITPPYQVGIGNDPHTYKLHEKIADKINRQCAQYGFDVIDGFDLVPHDAAFFADHAHPNDLGFSQYAFNLISRLKLFNGFVSPSQTL